MLGEQLLAAVRITLSVSHCSPRKPFHMVCKNNVSGQTRPSLQTQTPECPKVEGEQTVKPVFFRKEHSKSLFERFSPGLEAAQKNYLVTERQPKLWLLAHSLERHTRTEHTAQCRRCSLFNQSKRVLDVGQMRKYQRTKYKTAVKWQPPLHNHDDCLSKRH